MDTNITLGIDMGGTNVRGGLVERDTLAGIISKKINANGSAEEVLGELFSLTDELINANVTSMGIGVPGLVNNEEKMVYDVVNIPSWKKIPLQQLMEERYHIPVHIENDANCFALGEFYFGKGKDCNSMVGLTIGTGLGSGIIINKKLYAGKNGGAGEFGMIAYLDQYYEYYASGQFFKNVYNIDGEEVFLRAKNGDAAALRMYAEMGIHLGNSLKMLLFSLDVEVIVLGGSVRHAFPFFEESMRQQLSTFPFTRALEHLKIKVSTLENAGVLGAAGLCL
ncbi:MAG: ROK family protein [Ginsengibacter sp.]